MDDTSADLTCLLDLTRLLRRAGRPLTGVDRVEMAYLEHLPRHAALYGLFRTSIGFVLLDPTGCAAFARAANTQEWGAPDLLARLRGKTDAQARAEAFLRRLCKQGHGWRTVPQLLRRMLAKHLPDAIRYLNVGHSNFTPRVLRAVRRVPNSRIVALVHDTIPLDYPQFQRADRVAPFQDFLNRVAANADLVLSNSRQTTADIKRHAKPHAPIITAHLGVEPPAPGAAPQGPWTGAPYFLCLGTIEPRKNHAFLLDLWQNMPDAHLLIVGGRGWENADVFARLDQNPPRVHELSGLDDRAVQALMRDANGLLFPSLAEGFGLPPLEAAALGTPVICNTLPVYREFLADIPVYAPVSDPYKWIATIKKMAGDARKGSGADQTGFELPTWEAHFKQVLTHFR